MMKFKVIRGGIDRTEESELLLFRDGNWLVNHSLYISYTIHYHGNLDKCTTGHLKKRLLRGLFKSSPYRDSRICNK